MSTYLLLVLAMCAPFLIGLMILVPLAVAERVRYGSWSKPI